MDECGKANSITGHLDCYTATKANKVSIILMNEISGDMKSILDWQNMFQKWAPMINTVSSVDILGDKTLYQNYVLSVPSLKYYLLSLALVLKYFKFTEINFISEIALEPIYKLAVPTLAEAGIKISTPEELVLFNQTDPDICDKVSANLKNSNLKPVLSYIFPRNIIACYWPAFIAVGLEPSDIIIINSSDTYDNFI